MHSSVLLMTYNIEETEYKGERKKTHLLLQRVHIMQEIQQRAVAPGLSSA